MRIWLISLCMLAALSACISSSNPPAPQRSNTTVIVPPS